MPEIATFYGRQGLAEDLVSAVLKEHPQGISVEDLAPLDQFHTGGVASTRALAEAAGLRPEDHVLDIGAGLGGPARWLAAHHHCRVTCIDITKEYCEAAERLNELTGLSDLVDVRQGDALALPFEAAGFDVVFAQNAFMNIADKATLFREVARVLRPKGRFVFQEVMAGPVGPIHLPVTWADRPEFNFLATPDEHRRVLEDAGFRIDHWDDITLWASALPKRPTTSSLGMHLRVADLDQKTANNRRNEAEGRSILWRAVCIRE